MSVGRTKVMKIWKTKVMFVSMSMALLLLLGACNTGCNTKKAPIDIEEQTKALAASENYNVYNPYPSGATIPVNICPLNIAYPNRATTSITLTDSTGKTIATHKQYFSKTFKASEKKWRKWLQQAYKGSITISHGSTKHSYHIAEAIDPYASYRKTLFSSDVKNMYIGERNLTNFTERKLIISSTKEDTTSTCINCHIPKNNNNNYSLVHVRPGRPGVVRYPGTYLIIDGKVQRLSPEWDTLKAFARLAYYDFHPTKEKIVFSTNSDVGAERFATNQGYEYYMIDRLGIIVLYDIATNSLTTSKSVSDASKWEYANPIWNASGTEIYFLRGGKLEFEKPWKYLFDLCRAEYDSATNTFKEAEVVFPFSECGVSATQPKQVPGTNKWIITVHESTGSSPRPGDGDLYILDLDQKQNTPFQIGVTPTKIKTCTLPPNKYAKITALKEVNSADAEMYHSFSSNGKWMIFSSSRLTGEQNYPHIVYMDKNGNFGKPFAMPQKEPFFFSKNASGYVIPNLSKTPAGFENKKAAELYLDVNRD